MRVQRVLMPGSRFESWTVLGDDHVPVDPIERFLGYLSSIERSPNTVKAYAHDLKDWFTFLGGRGLDWQTATLEDVAGYVAWLRLPPEGRDCRVQVWPSVAHRRLDQAGTAITFDAVAREAGVSRSWLSSQADLRGEIQALRARRQPPASTPRTRHRQAASDASLLRRLEAATQRIRQLEEDNRQLREALAEALGATRAARITGKNSRRDTPGQQAAELIGPC